MFVDASGSWHIGHPACYKQCNLVMGAMPRCIMIDFTLFSDTWRYTPHELAFGGKLCRFGEPVFADVVLATKVSAKWKRMFSLGKPAAQNSYVLFDGQAIIPSRNVKKISGDHIWLTICIAIAFHGSTKLDLAHAFFPP